MARELAEVRMVEATLVAKTAFHVGRERSGVVADLEITEDGAAQPYVPGTSLAGVLRRLLSGTGVDDLFGKADSSGASKSAKSKTGFASRVIVADAPLAGVRREIRDHVGIDRRTGSAAKDIKHTRQVIAAGATLPLRLMVEVMPGNEAASIRAAVDNLVRVLGSRGLEIGGSTTRGLGRFEIEAGSLRARVLDISNIDDVRAWWLLRAGHPVPTPAKPVAVAASADGNGRWCFRVHWQPTEPLFVKDGVRGAIVDQLPLVSFRRETAGGVSVFRPLLPGSAIKGRLRSHAERILRTISGHGVAPGTSFLDQVAVPGIETLFGQARGEDSDLRKRAKSRLSVRDAYNRHVFAAHPRDLDAKGLADAWPGSAARTQVSIDRWTGGALDSALFSAFEPKFGDAEKFDDGWEPIVFEIDVADRSPDDAAELRCALALFWLILRDLVDGEIPLGYGTTKGYGAIDVRKIEVTDPNGLSLPALDGTTLAKPSGSWQAHVRTWNDAWNERIVGARREGVVHG